MGTTLPDLDDRPRRYPADDTDEIYGNETAFDDDYNWTGWPTDSRWRPAAAILGAVVAVGAVATAVIINSGDSASTKATLGPQVTSATATTTSVTSVAPPSASPRPARPPLPPETVTTVAPSRVAPSRTPAATAIAPPPVAAPLPLAAPPTAALNPRTVIYSVSGTKQLLDLVNIVYTDARGYPQTEFNVSLPWSKMVVMNPGIESDSVVATSFYGQLNCSIFNAAGQRVVASATSNLATCAR